MILHLPLKKGVQVTRWYSKNVEINSIEDFKLCITQGFGLNEQTYGPGGHNGLDLACIEGMPVYASHDGEAAAYEEKDMYGNYYGYGKYIAIRDRTNNFKTEYCHLNEVIKTGPVKAGELIGLSGNTGWSSGPHLHYTLKNPDAIDPLPYLVYDNMKLTKELVRQLQALEGYRDESGVEYWEGKELNEYMKARIPDKIKELESSING